MEAQSRGLTMAIKNANDGISLMQTSEGAMDEVTNILQRMRELSVQSVNGTNNAADRSALDAEVQQLKEEIDRIATTTEFNSQKILDGSFKDKVLQIGDKAYQTMDISIASVHTSDLGMGKSSLGGDMLVSQRVAVAAVDEGDILINGQELGAIAATDDLGDIIENINTNVDNVEASGFNVVVAKNVGTGVVSNSQLTIKVVPFSANTGTTFTLTASDSLQEMVDNINAESGGLVEAEINDDGKLVLSNNTGATIVVTDTSVSGAGFGTAGATTFTGFLQLEAKDDSALRIERGNLGKESPGTLADLAVLGFREVTKEPTDETYTVTGLALTSAGVGNGWSKTDLTINGVEIYDEDVATTSFAGKLAAINNFSDETGVSATAVLDKSFSVPTAGFVAGKHVSLNGVVIDTGANVAAFATNVNAKTTEHGLTATVNGDNIIFSGENVQKMTVEHVSAAYGARLTSSISATGATANAVRNVSFKTADIVEGRTLQLSIATTAGTGNVAVAYTIKAGDTVTSVAVGIKTALLTTRINKSGAAVSATVRPGAYLGSFTGTTVTIVANSSATLRLSGQTYGNANISLEIVDGPSSTIGTYESRINTASLTQLTARTLEIEDADVTTGMTYELRVVSGERIGPTGSSFTVRATATDGLGATLAAAFKTALDSVAGPFHGVPNAFNRNGMTSALAATVATNTLTLAAGTGYGRASIHFNAVDEVLGAADTHYGAIRLDSIDNSPISIALGEGATVAEHGMLEMNVGAADYQVNTPSLGVAFGSSLSGLNVSSASAASKAIGSIDNAIESVSASRASLGAYQNRLINTVNNLDNIVTNTEASRSRIQDTDYALETTALAKAQIIQQAATAMLAQANQQPQSVLALLQ
jgi:flagellin